MLFSPVYIEAHPRQNAAFASRPDMWALGGNRGRFPVPEMNLRDAASAASLPRARRSVSKGDSLSPNSFLPRAKGRGAFSSTSHFKANDSLKSFEIKRFRTLASHSEATVSSNPFGINRFRTLCKIPGIGYPPPSILFRNLLPEMRSASAKRTHVLCTFLQQVFCLPHLRFS
jgi:hypothetical protein